MNNCTTRKTFQQIPVNISGSLQSTYLYAKISMLDNKWYSETSLGKNAITHKQELCRAVVSQCVNELDRNNFIKIHKESLGDCKERNIYEITLFSSYWIPVMNDFINLPDLNPSEKGFAIRLACLKEMPKTLKELCAIIGISFPSCKKYIQSLEAANVLNGMQLNEEYFPNLRKQAYKNQYITKLNQLKQLTGNKRILNQIKWFENNLTPDKFPYKFLVTKLIEIEGGTWNRTEVKKEIKHLFNITI